MRKMHSAVNIIRFTDQFLMILALNCFYDAEGHLLSFSSWNVIDSQKYDHLIFKMFSIF